MYFCAFEDATIDVLKREDIQVGSLRTKGLSQKGLESKRLLQSV